MRLSTIVSLTLFIFFSLNISAQDFDGDSIYYTPISKTYGRKKIKPLINFSKTLVPHSRYSYFFAMQTGALIGCQSCSDGKNVTSTFSVLNGLTLGKKIRTGIGLGFDSYIGWQTVPVFASISWDIIGNKNRNAFFVQLQYGLSKAWYQKAYQEYGFKSADGGRMVAPQLGYRIKYHDLKVALLIGVKLQRVFSFYEYPTWNWVNGEYQPGTNKATIKQDMSRFMITMAVGWR